MADRTPTEHAGAVYFSAVGLVLAAAFFTASLTPSLMPRDAVAQGVLGGIVAAIGHELGGILVWIWGFLGLPMPGPARAPR